MKEACLLVFLFLSAKEKRHNQIAGTSLEPWSTKPALNKEPVALLMIRGTVKTSKDWTIRSQTLTATSKLTGAVQRLDVCGFSGTRVCAELKIESSPMVKAIGIDWEVGIR